MCDRNGFLNFLSQEGLIRITGGRVQYMSQSNSRFISQLDYMGVICGIWCLVLRPVSKRRFLHAPNTFKTKDDEIKFVIIFCLKRIRLM